MTMKRLTGCAGILLLALSVPAAAEASPAARAFDELKSLVGTWVAESDAGHTSVTTYRLTAGGSVLLEEFESKEPGDMTTMYHLDGSRLLLTHYCVAGNQPRMEADLSAAGSGRLEFSFVDGTNMESPAEGHMHHVVINLIDDNTMEQAWTFRKDGKDSFTEVVRFRRVK